MKIFSVIVTIACWLFAKRGIAQSFQNLNFEAARIVLDQSSPYYPNAVNSTNALPGWFVIGGVAPSDVLYDTVSIGSSAVSIHDANDPLFFTPIQGKYSVYLQGPVTSVAIAQTGQVPSTAQSLTFWSYFTGFQVSFNGQVIPYTSIGSGANYTVYSGDISAFAGQTGVLQFSGNGFLDNIQFSSSAVPEPSGLAFSSVGIFAIGFIRRRTSQP